MSLLQLAALQLEGARRDWPAETLHEIRESFLPGGPVSLEVFLGLSDWEVRCWGGDAWLRVSSSDWEVR